MSTFQFKTTENAFLGAIHVLKRLADDATIRAEERMACNTVMTAMAEFVEQAWADMTWAIDSSNHRDQGNFLHAAAGLLRRHQEAKREVHDLKAEAFKRRDVPSLSAEDLDHLVVLLDKCREVRAIMGEIPPAVAQALRNAAAHSEERPAPVPRSLACMHSMQSCYIDKATKIMGCTDCDDERKAT